VGISHGLQVKRSEVAKFIEACGYSADEVNHVEIKHDRILITTFMKDGDDGWTVIRHSDGHSYVATVTFQVDIEDDDDGA
jgi:hypothetical protein